MGPLEGSLVIDFQPISWRPSASLRLADRGARAIKIERPQGDDLCGQLYVSNLELDGDSTISQTIKSK
jgi:crotonobetainyl-CoA:carnitine CoA-transferase CaiB-like acyl-CoA transferase